MTSPIKPWLSQQDAQRIFCELADANLLAAQRERERDILQHALDEVRAERDALVETLRERGTISIGEALARRSEDHGPAKKPLP
jgi:hypothetical protein